MLPQRRLGKGRLPMEKKPEAGSPEDASDFTRKMLLAKKAAVTQKNTSP